MLKILNNKGTQDSLLLMMIKWQKAVYQLKILESLAVIYPFHPYNM